MNLLQSMAALFVDGLIGSRGGYPLGNEAECKARDYLKNAKPSGWLIEFPNGSVFVDSEPLMRINLANGYRVTPLFAGEEL